MEGLARGTAVVETFQGMNPTLVSPQDPLWVPMCMSWVWVCHRHPPCAHSHEVCQLCSSDRMGGLFHVLGCPPKAKGQHPGGRGPPASGTLRGGGKMLIQLCLGSRRVLGSFRGALQSPMFKTSRMQRGLHPFQSKQAPQPCHSPCQTGKITPATSPASPGYLQSSQTLSLGMPHPIPWIPRKQEPQGSGCTHTTHVLPRTSHSAMPNWSVCQALPSRDSTSPFPQLPPPQMPTFPCHCTQRCPKYQNHGSPLKDTIFERFLRTETCQGKPCTQSWPNTRQGEGSPGLLKCCANV